MDDIVQRTNQSAQKLSSKYQKKYPTIAETKNDELDALLGIFIMTGVFDCSHVAFAELFGAEFGPAFYKAAMRERRFSFLGRALRFDVLTDRFAAITNIWKKFIFSCKAHYFPGENLTIDQQFLAFRRQCPFWMYIANN